MKIQLTEDEKEQFIRDGYVVVKGLLSPKLVANIKDRLYSRLGINLNDSKTWVGKPLFLADLGVITQRTQFETPSLSPLRSNWLGMIL